MQCKQPGFYGSGEACTPCPKVSSVSCAVRSCGRTGCAPGTGSCASASALRPSPHLLPCLESAGWASGFSSISMLGMSPGCDLPRRLPNVADRRLLERRRGADMSLAGSCGGGQPCPSADVAGVSPVPVHMPSHFNPVLGRVLRGCAHAAPPQNAAEEAKSQTRLPSFERSAPTDAATNTQARRAALACFDVGAHGTARAAFAQARTAVPVRRGTSRRASSALRATQAPRTSCAPNTCVLCPRARSVRIWHPIAPLQVGHHVRFHRALRDRHFSYASQHGVCCFRFYGRAFLLSRVSYSSANRTRARSAVKLTTAPEC